MNTLLIDRRGMALEYQTGCVIIRAPDTPPYSLPLNRISTIVCMHNVELSTQLLGQLQRHEIDFVVLNQRHEQNSFSIFANAERQIYRRCVQYQWQCSDEHRFALAKRLCDRKLKMSARVIYSLDPSSELIDLLATDRARIQCAVTEDELRGIEGIAQRRVFGFWRQLLPSKLKFSRRQARHAPDPVNALLSLAYTMVYKESIRQCIRWGLDSQLGFYHRATGKRHSLACDLMETTRSSVERLVVEIFCSSKLDLRHFSSVQGRCFLGKEGRKVFYEQYDQNITVWRRNLCANAKWLSLLLKSN